MTTETTAPEIVADPEMEATHYGITVAHLGEDGDMVALGHHSVRRALAAFNRHARVFVGLINLADDRSATVSDWDIAVEQKWAVFRKSNPEDGEDPDYVWVCDYSAEGEPGARPVTLLEL